MQVTLSNAAPSTIVRVLDFMRRKDHHALLDADAEVLEAVAVHTVLSFVGYVRAAVQKKRGTCWLPRDFAFDRSCTDAVAYTVARRVVPRQLMEDGAAPLRRLLLDAVQPAAVVYVPCGGNSALQPWCDWLGQLVGVVPSDLCCTRVVLQADGVEATAELRFQHGRFPSAERLEEIPNGAKNGEASAYAAALAGHLDCLKCLKDTGSNLLKATLSGYTALHAAAILGRSDFLEFLLQKVSFRDCVLADVAHHIAKLGPVSSLGALFSASHLSFGGSRYSGTPLIFVPIENNRPDVLDFLLAARPGEADALFSDGHTLATRAAALGHVSLLQVLKDRTPLVSAKCHHGTPAYVAAANGQLAVLQYLRSINVSITFNLTRATGSALPNMAPVHAAAQTGHVACLQYLLDVEEPSIRQSAVFGASVARAACVGRQTECLQLLASAGCLVAANVDGRCAAEVAASTGNAACLNILADYGADFGSAGREKGETPLVFLAVAGNHTAALRVLIDRGGPQVLAPTAEGRTPLHEAASHGHRESVELLLPHSSVNAVDDKGRTAAHLAVWWDSVECLKLLVAAGANLKAVDNKGASLWSIARFHCQPFLKEAASTSTSS